MHEIAVKTTTARFAVVSFSGAKICKYEYKNVAKIGEELNNLENYVVNVLLLHLGNSINCVGTRCAGYLLIVKKNDESAVRSSFDSAA